MKLLLQALSVVLLIGGVPFFLLLGEMLGVVVASLPRPPGGYPEWQVEKFFQLYTVFALAGLVSATGCVLWAVTCIAYPLPAKSETKHEPIESANIGQPQCPPSADQPPADGST